MALKDVLKKTSILKSGSVAATYHSAKDRPIDLQDETIATPEDKKSSTKTQETSTIDSKKSPNNILITSILLAIVFVWLALSTTITWVIIIAWLVWLFYIYQVTFGKRSRSARYSLTTVLIVLCISSFILVVSTQSEVNNNQTNNASTRSALTTEECNRVKDSYDGKVLKISSDGLQGTIGLKIDVDKRCELQAYYNLLLSYDLPQNPYARDVGVAYNYLVTLREDANAERTEDDSRGALSPVFKNFTLLPDPFASGRERSDLYSMNVAPTETRYFSWGYQSNTGFSDDAYRRILNSTSFHIVDGLAFIEEQTEDGITTHGINYEKAGKSGSIVKSYLLTIEE